MLNFSFNTKLSVALLCITQMAMVHKTFAGECSQSEAFNKMMALGRAQSRLAASGNPADVTRGNNVGVDTSKVGQTLADKKYGEACARYDEIAKKYGIDLGKEQAGLVTYDELVKDGGRKGGACDLADASRKMMGMHQQLEDKVALGDVDRDVFRTFGADTTKLSELMYTNPSEACRQLDALKPKYGLK